jgi:hypothetical protein
MQWYEEPEETSFRNRRYVCVLANARAVRL